MSQAVKVGLFMTACLVVLGYFILKVEHFNPFTPKGQEVQADFDSVAGLDREAAVRVAGVRVGRVDAIRLVDRKARVTLRLEKPLRLTAGSSAAIASQGLLGDRYVELHPGPPDAPVLPPDAILPGETPITIDQAIAKLGRIGDSLQQVTGSLAGEGQETSVSRLIDNLEATSADIRELVAANRTEVAATVGNLQAASAAMAAELPKIAQQLETLLAEVHGIVGENRENLHDSMANVRTLTDDLQTSVDNLNEITGAIAGGKGTIGKLVESDEAHEELVSTLKSVQSGVDQLSEAFSKVQKLHLDLGFEGFYLSDLEDSQSEFHLSINPDKPKFYYVGVVDDPRGHSQTKTQEITVTRADGTSETTTVRRVTTENKVTLSAQFGFHFGRARLRGGLFQSTGGAGVDYGLLDDRLLFSLDAFEFNRPNDLDPHLRFTTRWLLNPHVYLVGGLDDFLVGDQDSPFVGLGVRWSDDDLKYLLGSVPIRF